MTIENLYGHSRALKCEKKLEKSGPRILQMGENDQVQSNSISIQCMMGRGI